MQQYTVYYLLSGDLCSIKVDATDPDSALTFVIQYLNRHSAPYTAIYLPDWN